MSFRVKNALCCAGVLVLTAGGGAAASLASTAPAGATVVGGATLNTLADVPVFTAGEVGVIA